MSTTDNAPAAEQSTGHKAPQQLPLTVIEAQKNPRINWAELWQYRQLFFHLAWRDFLVRYKQTLVGVLWAVIQPLLTMIVLTVIFGKVAGLDKDTTAPYAVLVYAGVLPWQFFAASLNNCSLSLLNNASILGKIYFPRLLLPASAILVNFIDFAISLLILASLMLIYGVDFSLRLLAIVPLMAMTVALAMGIGSLIASLNVRYRDFKFILPFLIQTAMYITPVGFASANVPAQWQTLYSLNPVVGIIDGFRWAILGNVPLNWNSLGISLLVCSACLVFGTRFFRRSERWFADLI